MNLWIDTTCSPHGITKTRDERISRISRIFNQILIKEKRKKKKKKKLTKSRKNKKGKNLQYDIKSIIFSTIFCDFEFRFIATKIFRDTHTWRSYLKIQIEKDNSPCAVKSNTKRPTNRSGSMSSLFRKHCQQTTQLAL